MCENWMRKNWKGFSRKGEILCEMCFKEGTKTHWPSQKFKIGLPFPNIPFYIDGNIKLSQSGAILRHLGKKYKMYGANDNEASIIDMLIELSADLRLGLAKQAYSQPDFVSIFAL